MRRLMTDDDWDPTIWRTGNGGRFTVLKVRKDQAPGDYKDRVGSSSRLALSRTNGKETPEIRRPRLPATKRRSRFRYGSGTRIPGITERALRPSRLMSIREELHLKIAKSLSAPVLVIPLAAPAWSNELPQAGTAAKTRLCGSGPAPAVTTAKERTPFRLQRVQPVLSNFESSAPEKPPSGCSVGTRHR